MISNKIVVRLLIAALVMPVALCVLLAAAHLLGAMGDSVWAAVLLRAALVGSLVWLINLIALLLAVAAHMAFQAGATDKSQDE